MEEPMSLESPIDNEENSQLSDFIKDDDALEPMDEAARDIRKDTIQDALSVLTDRENHRLEPPENRVRSLLVLLWWK